MSDMKTDRNCKLEIIAPIDWPVEVSVLNGSLDLEYTGPAPKTLLLIPGLYSVSVNIGYAQSERIISLEKGQRKVLDISQLTLEYSSSVALKGTLYSHDYQQAFIESESRRIHAGEMETECFIFIVVREWFASSDERIARIRYDEDRRRPANGLKLLDINNGTLVDIYQSCAAYTDHGPYFSSKIDPCTVCKIGVHPGPYRLQLTLSSGQILEQIVIASPGWQTQVHLLLHDYGSELTDRRADIYNASIIMKRHDANFAPWDSDIRLAEMARLGLQSQRQILSDDLTTMLSSKFENPLAGIYGAHLLMMRRDTVNSQNIERLRNVITNTRHLLKSPHPDVEALALNVGLGSPQYRFAVPPMLQQSWSLVVSHSVINSEIILPKSLAYRIATRLVPSNTWLIWMGSDLERGNYRGAKNRSDETLASYERAIRYYAKLPETETIEALVYKFGLPRGNIEELRKKANI